MSSSFSSLENISTLIYQDREDLQNNIQRRFLVWRCWTMLTSFLCITSINWQNLFVVFWMRPVSSIDQKGNLYAYLNLCFFSVDGHFWTDIPTPRSSWSTFDFMSLFCRIQYHFFIIILSLLKHYTDNLWLVNILLANNKNQATMRLLLVLGISFPNDIYCFFWTICLTLYIIWL